MRGHDLRAARRTLGKRWGLDRPLELEEMAKILRLSGRDPAASLRDYEHEKTKISGPLSLAVELLLAGGEPPEGQPGGGNKLTVEPDWIDVSTLGSPFEQQLDSRANREAAAADKARYRRRGSTGEPLDEWKPGFPPSSR